MFKHLTNILIHNPDCITNLEPAGTPSLLQGVAIHVQLYYMLQMKEADRGPCSALRWEYLPPACICNAFWLRVCKKKLLFSFFSKVFPSTERNVDTWPHSAISFQHVSSRQRGYLSTETEICLATSYQSMTMDPVEQCISDDYTD